MTNREQVLSLIRQTPGLTDSEIREMTGIRPHQQVNQICRFLAGKGLIRRVRGHNARLTIYHGVGNFLPGAFRLSTPAVHLVD